LLSNHRIDFQDMVQVKVGPDKTLFTIPRSVLCSSSPFFNAAFSKQWKENEEKCLSLPEEKANIFSIFLQWAFTGHIVTGLPAPTKANITSAYFDRLFDLYVFGDKYNSRPLKNRLMDMIVAARISACCVPSATNVQRVIAKVPAGSKLLEWCFDVYVYEVAPTCFDVKYVRTCPELFSEVMMRTVTFRNSGKAVKKPAATLQACYYHEHDESTPKCA